jgi:hypothetical protein
MALRDGSKLTKVNNIAFEGVPVDPGAVELDECPILGVSFGASAKGDGRGIDGRGIGDVTKDALALFTPMPCGLVV